MCLLLIRMALMDSGVASLSLSISSSPSTLPSISGLIALSCSRTRGSRTLRSSLRRADSIWGLAFR
jgi:hypothetical protein